MAGLGNPGRRYSSTRHNVGYRVIDETARLLGICIDQPRWNALVGSCGRNGVEVWLIKPTTMMNDSGKAVNAAAQALEIAPEELLVVCDDFHLPEGSLRARRKGSAGGHNGLENVLARRDADTFARLRVGIGEAPPGRAVDYVLAAFTREEEEIIEEMVRRAAEAVLVWLDHGIQETMNRFNRARTSPPE